jgi:hypothetical protein
MSLKERLDILTRLELRPATERLQKDEPLVALGFGKDRELSAYPGFFRSTVDLPVPAGSSNIRSLIEAEMSGEEGLSGAILFDRKSRAAGMIVQGKTLSERLSLSYSVPIRDLVGAWR